jgi:hypothetical protein
VVVAGIWFVGVLLLGGAFGKEGASEPDAFWGTEDVAAYLGVPIASVRYWAYKGSGPPSYKIGRRRKYRPSEVKEWAEAQREERSAV